MSRISYGPDSGMPRDWTDLSDDIYEGFEIEPAPGDDSIIGEEIFGEDLMGACVGGPAWDDSGEILGEDENIFGEDLEIGFDPFKSVSRAAKSVVRSVKGAVRGTGGAFKSLIKLKPREAGKQMAKAVTSVTNNKILQAGWPGTMVPAAVLGGAAKGGPKGAIAAARQVMKNPLIKAELAVASVLFPPVAPLSGAAVAATESASRVYDALRSGNLKQIGAAAVQVAATSAAAASGNPQAQRALKAFRTVEKGYKVARGAMAGVPSIKKKISSAKSRLKAPIKTKAQSKSAKTAQKQLSIAQMLTTRLALKDLSSRDKNTRKRASQLIARLQRENPMLVAAVKAAFESPRGLTIGKFSVIRTGRILLNGKPVRDEVRRLPKGKFRRAPKPGAKKSVRKR